jgi:gliding motility-associated-like protein
MVVTFNVLNKDQLCSNQVVEFEDVATVDFGEITRIEWDFDAANPTDLSSKIIYTDPNLRTDPVKKKYQFQYPVFHSPLTKTITVKMKVFSGVSCFSETEKQIVLNAAPEVAFSAIKPVCEEADPLRITQASEIHTLAGKGEFSGTGITAGGIFNPKTAGPGIHEITYTFVSSSGCSDQKSQAIMVYASPVASAGKDTVILEGGQVQLNGIATGNNITYKWSPSIGLDDDRIVNPVAKPTDDTPYVLTVTSDEGCRVSDEVFIKVLKSPVIPNAFTPNGDGVNDKWNIQYLESYPGATITIFNRLGNKVFYSVGYSGPWDGKFNGNELPSATYYYIINPKNGQRTFSGSISIIR